MWFQRMKEISNRIVHTDSLSWHTSGKTTHQASFSALTEKEAQKSPALTAFLS
ncbi:hypothetical protein QNI19_06360 [Cytophagaceae bacterium DM2B3-1]|uniref:Uncharacterized protein n=1 Tax=Xanthocytophaga flava TaxID=3048013 RepID=A0ABT7CGA2_9BACT|nr:hypothetical protein [Xanthocytophaga flavus]MDJ1492546.1 hypothetical protein [Xanthocytophaga flavus]